MMKGIAIGFLLVLTIFVAAEDAKKVFPPEHYIVLGDKAFSSGEYSEAIKQYTEALDVDRENSRALNKRAEAYTLNKQYAFANADLNTLVKLLPTSAPAHSFHGKVSLLLGEFEQASMAYSNAIQLKPDDKDAAEKLKKTNHLAEQYKTAITSTNHTLCVIALGNVLSEAKESVKIRLERVKCALAARLFPMVQMEIKTVLAKDSANIEAILLYSKYLYHLGAVDKAKDLLKDKCLKSDPDNRPCKTLWKHIKTCEAIYQRATQFYDQRNYLSALREFEDFVKTSDKQKDVGMFNDAEVRTKMCHCYAELVESDDKYHDKGIQMCSSVIDDEEQKSGEYHTECLIHRANIYLTADEEDKAQADAEEAKKAEGQKHHQLLNELQQRMERIKRVKAQKDYYKALGFDKKDARSITKKDIKKAYNKVVMKNHPDRMRQATEDEKKKAEKRFKEVTEAYEVLTNDEKREQYDRGDYDFGQPGGGPGHGHHGGQQFHFQQGFPGFNPFGGFGQQGGFQFNF